MSQLYNNYAQKRLNGSVNWKTMSARLLLLDDTYVFDPTHVTYADLGSSVLRISDLILNKTAGDGVANSDPAVFTDPALQAGLAQYAVIWNPGGDYLLAYLDDLPGLP